MGKIRSNSSAAQKLMQRLCYDVGPRPPATPAMRQAQRILARELRKIGAHAIHAEPVSIRTWKARPSALELVSPVCRTYDSYHLVHTAQADRVILPLVDGGRATTEELNRLEGTCRGAAVLIHGFDAPSSGGKFVPLQIRARNVVKCGGAAVVVRSVPESALPTVELIGVDENLRIPAVGVSASVGSELEMRCRRGNAKVRLTAMSVSGRGRCSNLVAEMGRPQRGNEVVILSAHLDTFFNNAGAFDNLSGVVTLMEIARALAEHQERFRRTLRLIIFTGEEYGFIGSKAYVARHSDELDNIRFVFNMDSLFSETARGVAVMSAPKMRDYIARALVGAPWHVDVRNLFCMSSDYLPFVLAGVGAARPADWSSGKFPSQSHTVLDTPNRVPIEWIQQNATVFAMLLSRIVTDAKVLPVGRMSAEQVRRQVAHENAVELLRCYAFEI